MLTYLEDILDVNPCDLSEIMQEDPCDDWSGIPPKGPARPQPTQPKKGN